jgi:hypothetical protein
MGDKKSHISISLSGTEGNAFAIIAKVHEVLVNVGLEEEAEQAVAEFRNLAHAYGSTYERVGSILTVESA